MEAMGKEDPEKLQNQWSQQKKKRKTKNKKAGETHSPAFSM